MMTQTLSTIALDERMEFIKFGGAEKEALKAEKSVINGALENALTNFYKQVSAFEEPSQFFKNEDHMNVAKGAQAAQARHWDHHWARHHWDRITDAGVEAARAGEAGKGFAVIAQKMRVLAQRCASAAKEISDLIKTSGKQIDVGVINVKGTSDALTKLVGETANLGSLISRVETSAKEQSTTLGEINSAIVNLDTITQQNARMVEETTAAAASLRDDVGQLVGAMAQFRTRQEPHSRSGTSQEAA